MNHAPITAICPRCGAPLYEKKPHFCAIPEKKDTSNE